GAGPFPLVERGEHAERRPDAGAEIDQRDTHAHRRPVALAGDAHDPRGSLEQRVVAGPFAQRTAPTERPDRAVDEAWVPSTQLRCAQPVPVGRSRAKALEEDVRAVGEVPHDLAAAAVAEIDGERALAGVRGEEHRTLPIEKRRPPGPG